MVSQDNFIITMLVKFDRIYSILNYYVIIMSIIAWKLFHHTVINYIKEFFFNLMLEFLPDLVLPGGIENGAGCRVAAAIPLDLRPPRGGRPSTRTPPSTLARSWYVLSLPPSFALFRFRKGKHFLSICQLV
jgi:hypothetical protein